MIVAVAALLLACTGLAVVARAEDRYEQTRAESETLLANH